MVKKTLDKKIDSSLLARAIEASGVAEAIRHSVAGNTVKVLYRVHDKRLWLGILEYTLSRADGWSAHICQQYFMRGGKLVYGWNFILQSEGSLATDLMKVAQLLVAAAKVVPQMLPRGPLESYPLVGASPRRTAKIAFDPRLPGPDKGGPSHKGAYSIRSGEQG